MTARRYITKLKNTPSNGINLLPIGFVDRSILIHLSESIAEQCSLPCYIDEKLEIPEHTLNPVREQYDSKEMLKHLLAFGPPEPIRIIGVTGVDLFVPILKYVFGVAQIKGRCAVISLKRLFPQFYDRPPDEGLVKNRVEKTALHELGHTFGLTHCRDHLCVMYSSTRIADTDTKNSAYCITCSDLLKWYLDKSMD